MTIENKLIVFNNKNIRRTWFNDEWWFVATDIIEVLTDSKNPSQYLKDMRRRDDSFNEGWVQIATTLPIETKGGLQKLNCISTKGAFRLIQSIPSKKAEPFKRWLAKVGSERIQEIENPEIAQNRAKSYYELKGYSKEWIDKRLRSIAIRQNLTDEWKERGINKQKDFAILTAEISKATFGLSPSEYKNYKEIPTNSNINLRDHMDDLELIFSMLGERVTTEISQEEKPNTFEKNKIVASRGGTIAGNARKETEKELSRSILSKKNYLPNEPDKIE